VGRTRTGTTIRPPRLAEWIASRTVPRRERACVLGDLQEDFETIAQSESPRAARRWYWSQVIRSLPRSLRTFGLIGQAATRSEGAC
jgi:hypothetical protein